MGKIDKFTEDFSQWLSEPIGAGIVDLERRCLAPLVSTMFGYEAIVLGDIAFRASLETCLIKNKIFIDIPEKACEGVLRVSAQWEKLPINSDYVDLVYLAHCLEFAVNPQEVLQEVHRILRPDGHVLISIFNPYGAWGIWRSIARFGNRAPWRSNFISVAKIRGWLGLLGFDIIRINHFGYSLPLKHLKPGGELSFIERSAQRFNLPFGAVYIVEASKRIIPVTPIRPVWQAAADVVEEVEDITGSPV